MSATIYQFPVGGRRNAGEQREESKPALNLPALNFAAARNVKTVLGNGWYHDEAIEEDRTPKN